MKDGKLGGYQIIAASNQEEEISNVLFCKDQGNNTSKGTEAIALLKVIAVIDRKCRNINNSKLITAIDNQKVCSGIVKKQKSQHFTKDVGAEVAQIKRILDNIEFEVKFKSVRGHYNAPISF